MVSENRVLRSFPSCSLNFVHGSVQFKSTFSQKRLRLGLDFVLVCETSL